MEYIRQWKVGDETFGTKREAQAREAELGLAEILGSEGNAYAALAKADAVIALLRPFATPKTRKSKSNGSNAGRRVPRQAEATT